MGQVNGYWEDPWHWDEPDDMHIYSAAGDHEGYGTDEEY